MNRIIRKYRKYELVILIDRFALVGGALKSIIGYYKYKTSVGESVLLLSRSVKFRVIKYLLVILFSPKILVNSLSAFDSWIIIFALFLRKDAVVYLHESGTAIKAFREKKRLKYYFLNKILKRNKIACDSVYQQEYLQDNFNSNTELVYYYTPPDIKLPKKEGRKIILMAGYLMERKGVSFYSKIADYVVEDLQLPWDFYWAGSKASTDKMYQSKNVIWLGDVELMDVLYPQIDVFFLSSIDEPFGLVCVEALKYYTHVVAFKDAGASELLATVGGCKVYDKYDIISAVAAINNSLKEEIDKDKVDYIIKDLMSLKSFVHRIDRLYQVNTYV